MRVHFLTDDFPPHDREQVWLDVFAKQVVRVTPRDRPDLGRFRAHLDAQIAGRFTLIDFQTTHRTGGRTSADVRNDNSDRFQLRRVRREQIYTAAPTRLRSEQFRLAPGDFCVSSCEWPYAWETQDGTSASGLLIPRAVLSPLVAGGRLTGPVVIPPRTPLGTLLEAVFAAVNTQIPFLSPELGDAVLQNLCGLVALACGASQEGRASGRDSLRAARLEAAKRYIDQHLADPDLTPASTAAALGISLRHLHLLFEPTGTSFAQYVMQRRLLQCRAALEGPAVMRSVTDVAFAWGFSNLTTFYRAFRREFGMAPGEVRAACG